MGSGSDAGDSWRGLLLFRLGVLVFALSIGAGFARCWLGHRWLPPVGVEYMSEVRATIAKQGDAAALPQLRAAARIDFDNEQPSRELLELAWKTGDHTDLLPTLERLVHLHPQDGSLRNELVSKLLSDGRVGEAYSHGLKAVELTPDSAFAFGNLGAALLGLGQFREAAAAYRRALAIDPNLESARQALRYPLRDY